MYLSPQHFKALANIEFALKNRDNFVVISGEIGVGKTTILNQIIADLPQDVAVATLTHTTLSPTELLQSILADFGIESYTKNKVQLLKQITQFFQEQQAAGKQIAILIDEAQNLSKTTLEELRLLSCQNLGLSNLVTIVLLGQPELNDIIDSPELEQLSQRIRIRQHIHPLNEQEIRNYLERRLEVAGRKLDEVVSSEAVALIYAYSGGIPRMVNTLSEMAFTAAWIEESNKVELEHVHHAATELHWKFPKTKIRALADIPKSAPPIGWLLRTNTDKESSRVPIYQVPFFLGRSVTTNLQLRHPYISRRHAFIDTLDEQLILHDYNSYNGTFVNGQRIEKSHVLTDGDVISFGGGPQLVFSTRDIYPAEVDATTESDSKAISA